MSVKKQVFKRKKKQKKRKSRYHRGTYTSIIAGECRYRSGWEQKYMEHLDSDPNVVSWSYEKLIIEYISNNRTKKIRKYYPDFQVEYSNGDKFVIEIKPSKKLKQLNILKKISAAIKWCIEHDMIYKVLTEIELKSLGVI